MHTKYTRTVIVSGKNDVDSSQPSQEPSDFQVFEGAFLYEKYTNIKRDMLAHISDVHNDFS